MGVVLKMESAGVMQKFLCLADHSENARWGEVCGREFTASPGGHACPFCGALYVRRIA